MRRLLILVASVLALGLALAFAPASHARATYSDVFNHSDCAGNGCLTVYYRIKLGYSVGFVLESVKISTSGGGILYGGATGKGASCWNEDNVVKWSKSPSATSLGKSDSMTWNPSDTWPDASTLTCGWYWTDEFTGGGINECAKVKIHHSDWSAGGCSTGKRKRP